MTPEEAVVFRNAVFGGYVDDALRYFNKTADHEREKWPRYAGMINDAASRLLGREVKIFYLNREETGKDVNHHWRAIPDEVFALFDNCLTHRRAQQEKP